jgi:hypothetical protein
MKKETLVFIGFFFEALKPHATTILDTAIDIADAAVAASTRLEVRSAEDAISSERSTLST